MVPADEVKELVARREAHLTQPLVGLHARGQPDLVAIGPVPPAASRVVAKEGAPRTEGAHRSGESFERALDEDRPGRDVEIGLREEELFAQSGKLSGPKDPLGEREHHVAHRVRDGVSLQLTMRRGHRAEYQPSRAARSLLSAGFSVSWSARRSAARASSDLPSARRSSARVA